MRLRFTQIEEALRFPPLYQDDEKIATVGWSIQAPCLTLTAGSRISYTYLICAGLASGWLIVCGKQMSFKSFYSADEKGRKE